jgi:cysteine-rich secretory family protein
MVYDKLSRPHSDRCKTRTPSRFQINVVILLAALILPALAPVCAAPGAEPAQSDVRQTSDEDRMETLAKQMWVLVNRDREDPWNDRLAAVALAHSRDMLRRRYFAHVDPEGRTPTGRINAAGIRWRALAENIAANRTVTNAENDLMDEPRFQQNHRGNILNPAYTDVGIGIVQGPNGDLYITQDFIAIPPERGGVRSGR